MSNRRLKVYRKPGLHSNTVPEMRIRGVWLTKLGFRVGDQVELVLEEKQIVIRPAGEGLTGMIETSYEMP